MIEDLYAKHEQLEAQLAEATAEGGEVRYLQRELAQIEDILGLRVASLPLRTGDPVSDYLLQRQLSGKITAEDLELTPDEILRRIAKEERRR